MMKNSNGAADEFGDRYPARYVEDLFKRYSEHPLITPSQLRQELNFVIELHLAEAADRNRPEAPPVPPSKLKPKVGSLARHLNEIAAFLSQPPSNFLSYFDDAAVRLARRGQMTPDFPVRQTPFLPEQATPEWSSFIHVEAVAQLDHTLERMRWLAAALDETAIGCEKDVEQGWARKGSDVESLYHGLAVAFGMLKGRSGKISEFAKPPHYDPITEQYVGEILDFFGDALFPLPEGKKTRSAIAQQIRSQIFNIRK
jgi:hypothetical protein